MSLVFEKVTQTIVAGEKWVTGIAGSFLRLSECQWPVTVVLLKENREVGSMRNMLAGDYASGVDFDMVWVVNGATAQTVGLQISAGGAGSNRVMGEVSVIDGGKFRTLAGIAFSGRYAMGAAPGVYNHIQLWNPAASGKILYIEQVIASVGVADGVNIYPSAVQLASLHGNPRAKKAGGVNSTAELRYEVPGAYPFAPAVVALAGLYLPAAMGQAFAPKEPYALPPGYGLNAAAQTTNNALNCTFEFYEESI